NLSHLIRSAAGTKTANELDEFCQMLQPYRDRRLKDLISAIAQAEEIIRNGASAAKAGRAPKKTVDIGPISARIVDLYQRAGHPTVTREEILGAFAELEALNLTKPQLEKIAIQIDVREKLKKKEELLNRMRQTLLDRKGVSDRVLV